MTRSEMRKVFYGYQEARRKLLRVEMELNEVHNLMTSIKAFDYSTPRVQSSQRGDRLPSLIDRLKKLEEKCEIARDEALDKMERVKCLIEEVSDSRIQEILSRKYIIGQSWKKISEEMHTDTRWLLRLQSRGFDELRRNYDS